MIEEIKEHISQVTQFHADTKEELEAFRIQYLGKKGVLSRFFAEIKNVPDTLKKEFGQTVNALKTNAEEKVALLNATLENAKAATVDYGDLTRPATPVEIGSRHPVSIVTNKIIEVFFQYRI